LQEIRSKTEIVSGDNIMIRVGPAYSGNTQCFLAPKVNTNFTISFK
jgi:hypothetical protein